MQNSGKNFGGEVGKNCGKFLGKIWVLWIKLGIFLGIFPQKEPIYTSSIILSLINLGPKIEIKIFQSNMSSISMFLNQVKIHFRNRENLYYIQFHRHSNGWSYK